MLILATLCLFVVFKDGEVTRSESVAFLVLYVFYVVIVIAGDRVPPMLKSERPAWHAAREAKTDPSRQSSLHESLDEGREQSADYAERSRDDHNLMLPKIGEISMKVDRFSQKSVISARELASKGGASGALAAGVGSPRLREAWKSQAGAGAIGGGALGIDTGLNNFTPITRSKSQQFDPRKGWTKYMLRNKFQESVEWSEMGLSDKLLFAIEAPFLLARGVSIPAVVEDPDDPEWNSGFTRMQMVLNPPFALPYLVGGFADMLGLDEYITVYVNILLVLLGMGGMYLAFMLTEEKPHPILVKIYIVVAFLNALFWIGVIADDLVALLTTFGEILQQYVDHAILGLTVLAMGNSLGDMAADLSVARGGFPNMAVTACYGGPFFNMCIGIGVAFFTNTANGPISKATGRADMELPTTLAFSAIWLIGVLILTLIAAAFFNFHLPSKFGFAMIGAYSIFTLLAVVITVTRNANNVEFDQID